MVFLDSHPWLHSLLVVVTSLGFFGGAVADLFLHLHYCSKVAKAARIVEQEKTIDDMKAARLYLGVTFLVSGFAFFSLVTHQTVAK
jgi:hypothetical protein